MRQSKLQSPGGRLADHNSVSLSPDALPREGAGGVVLALRFDPEVVRRLVRASRREQNLPDQITDQGALDHLAALIKGWQVNRGRMSEREIGVSRAPPLEGLCGA